MRLAVISTHPIQYYAPLFRSLTERGRVDVRVFFGWRGAAETEAHDPGFGQDVQWDIPLLEGYDHTFVENTARDPGTHHVRGLVNPDLIPQVEAWQPDALLVFGWGWWSHLRALHHFSGRVPVFFRGDSTLLDERGGLRTLARRLFLRWVYRYVDGALYVGQHNKGYFEKHGLREAQLAWAPHAIENARFYDEDGEYQQQADAWRKERGIPEEAVVFLFAGKLGTKKDPLLLLKAFQALESDDVHLVFAGSGPLEADLKQHSSGNEQVHFLGFQNQSKMPIVYRLGDAFVLPSQGPGETWGLAVNEAMACERPVVVSDRVGCAPDLVEPGANGCVFEAGDAGALRRALRRLSSDVEQLRAMGRRSQEIIEDWSISAEAEYIEEVVLHHLSQETTRPGARHASA
jgi:glycosyltransferase involved in cell wall biosynthesis